MAKMIIEVEGKEYKFELDREEIKRGERLGFDRTKIESQSAIQMDLFWSIGLHKNQPNLAMKKCEELLVAYASEGGDVSEVINFLGEQYQNFSLATQVDTKPLKKARVEN